MSCVCLLRETSFNDAPVSVSAPSSGLSLTGLPRPAHSETLTILRDGKSSARITRDQNNNVALYKHQMKKGLDVDDTKKSCNIQKSGKETHHFWESVSSCVRECGVWFLWCNGARCPSSRGANTAPSNNELHPHWPQSPWKKEGKQMSFQRTTLNLIRLVSGKT